VASLTSITLHIYWSIRFASFEMDQEHVDDKDPTATAILPRIESLAEYQVMLHEEIRVYLTSLYAKHYTALAEQAATTTQQQQQLEQQTSTAEGQKWATQHVQQFCHRMKQSPKQAVLRINDLQRLDQRRELMQQVQQILSEWIAESQRQQQQQPDDATNHNITLVPLVQAHDKLDDVITIDFQIQQTTTTTTTTTTKKAKLDTTTSHTAFLPTSLFACRVPHPPLYRKLSLLEHTTQQSTTRATTMTTREQQGWPSTHRVILVDRYCGEAVLRGADIFVKGILIAETGIRANEAVAVYAHVNDKNGTTSSKVTCGMHLSQYQGHCIFLGLGRAQCDRAALFSQSSGVAVKLSIWPYERAGPMLPPLHGKIPALGLYPQNLPSILVGHALDPQPDDCIYDMCGAPGGKTSHLAMRTQGRAVVVMSDRSRKKVVTAKATFDGLNHGNSIVPMHIDATKCVDRTCRNDSNQSKTVQEVS